jgi:hypothetical protein
MLAVGIEAAGEAAVRARHLGANPIDRLGDALGIERAARLLPSERQ